MMTARQYYFPYLFSLPDFNAELFPFGLHAWIVFDDASNMPEQLLVAKTGSQKSLLSLSFGKTLMIHGGRLFYWETDTNLLDIVEVDLDGLSEDPWLLQTKIDLDPLYTGRNPFSSQLDTPLFISYAKKTNLAGSHAREEKYVIVIITSAAVTILPFDLFNQANSEYDYSWPAIARLNTTEGKLYGEGIRVPAFCIDVDHKLL